MNMPGHDILFEDEKKSTVTNILDNAVKQQGMSQSYYIEIKSEIFNLIESPGNEKIGLNQIVTMTIEAIGKMISASEPESNHSSQKRRVITRIHSSASISKSYQKVTKEKPLISSNGEQRLRLIKLVELLPPYLDEKAVIRYKRMIATIPVAPRTEFATAKSTGDIDYEIVLIVSKAYKSHFEEILKAHPKVFFDIDLKSGKERDMSRQLRRNLESVKSLREFLSLKDLIGRHIEHYQNSRPVKKSIKERLMFWK